MKGAFGDALVVDIADDGVRSVRGMAPGPAGAATIEVGDGVLLSVDFADPSVLCEVELAPDADAEVMDALIGAKRAATVRGVDAPGRPVRIEGHPANDARFSSLPTEAPASELAAVTSLASLAEDPRRAPLARVANAAEVLVALDNGVRGLANGASVARRMERVLVDAATVAHGDASWLSSHHRTLARRLADLLERVGGDRIDVELVSLLRSSRRSSTAPLSNHLPGVVAPFVEQRPGRVTATMPNGRGAWLRVADSSTMVLHALVPFVQSGSVWRADAVVAPDLPPERVLVAVTHDPVPAAANAADKVRWAIALGRRAVEQAQVRQLDRSAECWRACEAAWRELGDEARAARADDYAERRTRPGRPTSLGERINNSLGAEVLTGGT
jgi:hypothetical protein